MEEWIIPNGNWMTAYDDKAEYETDDEDIIEDNDEFDDEEDTLQDKGELVASMYKTPDGTVMWSRYTHDFVRHKDNNGEEYFLDGGTEYQRIGGNIDDLENVSVYENDDFEIVRKYALRGTFDDKGFRVYRPICDLTDEHLSNILKYESEHGRKETCHSRIVAKEIEYRKENGISKSEKQ